MRVLILTLPLPGNPVWAMTTQSPNALKAWGQCETKGTPWQSDEAVSVTGTKMGVALWRLLWLVSTPTQRAESLCT